MIKVIFWLFSFLTVSITNDQFDIGSQLRKTDVNLRATDGKFYNLKSIKKENGLLVIFSCNTCPYVIAWQDRYNELHALADSLNIGMVLLNPNEDYRKNEDSFKSMQIHAKKNQYRSIYAIDPNHEIADAFGATKTPHVFLFDTHEKLVYRGAIDDNKNRDEVTEEYLKNAMKLIVAGKAIIKNDTKSIGCSIKRIKKS